MFQIEDGRKQFYQWDLNRKLIVNDPEITEAHYYQTAELGVLICEVEEYNGMHYVDVPNILFQISSPFKVYGCYDEHTIGVKQFSITAREKPEDYVYTETEVKRWEDLENRANDALDIVTDLVDETTAHINRLNSETEANKNNIDKNDKRITNIEHHINNNYFITEETVDYEKNIPDNVCPYAEINKIYGAGIFNNSLAWCSSWSSGNQRDIQITVNVDRSVNIKGTFEAELSAEHLKVWFNWQANNYNSDQIYLDEGTYTFSGKATGQTPSINYGRFILKKNGKNWFDIRLNQTITLTLEKGYYTLFFMLSDKSSGNNGYYNITLRPMLTKGHITEDWKGPIYANIKSIKSINSAGKNIDTFVMPQEIQDLLGYGQGSPYYSLTSTMSKNYLDLNNKTFVRSGYYENGRWVNSFKTTDVSDYLPESVFIKVDGGGKLVPELKEPIDIRTNITYLLKEGSI